MSSNFFQVAACAASGFGLETFKMLLAALQNKAAKEGIVYTEAQLAALQMAKL